VRCCLVLALLIYGLVGHQGVLQESTLMIVDLLLGSILDSLSINRPLLLYSQ
jgi:hypothetical protein